MKVIKTEGTSPTAPRVGDLPWGSTVINGEGNLCLVARSDTPAKVRLVNLETGGTYLVNAACRHEAVDAVVTWKYKEVT